MSLASLAGRQFELLIVGGGINGAGFVLRRIRLAPPWRDSLSVVVSERQRVEPRLRSALALPETCPHE
ncbi:MAG: hypothetical protein HY597_00695 [Candidatus Omnitrophica bacterium]|nr:hypothetical protein [Candidatus Omnitrophota bacterium]